MEFKNYKSLEAYDRFLSGWVQKVQVFATSCNVEGSILNMSVVRAKVNHSQRLSQSPGSMLDNFKGGWMYNELSLYMYGWSW